ncbi:hypothetical protein FJR11_04365 [Anabaena sp. UHCC 0187]|uniref:hypothetical protein n=1 Tax=Anabaena sp. UHCC 0187 TaxID=2590018 RepID=UPI001445DC39|nr:hypothetical protein [Anabaena sp. UHCC 0187]MTJ11841.1 hypothetical protein [Anabaena sp. UHCC 0187]
MVSKAFSFRLPDEAVQALQSQGLENETLNQTAQRVLTEALGLSASLSLPKRMTAPIDMQELVEREVERILAASTTVNSVVNNVTARKSGVEASKFLDSLGERVEKVENRLCEVEETLESLHGEDFGYSNTVDAGMEQRIKAVEESLAKWILRLSDLMDHWEEKVAEQVDRLDRKLGTYYDDVRDDTLKKLKVGGQSAQGKAIDRFIRELEKNEG